MPNFDDDPEPYVEEKEAISIEPEIVPEPVVEVKKETKLDVSPTVVKERKVTEPTIEEKPVRKPGKNLRKDRPVMQRTYKTKQGTVEIAYINYSKVRVSMPGQEVEIKEFASSKEAVDYYVEQMQKLEELYSKEN